MIKQDDALPAIDNEQTTGEREEREREREMEMEREMERECWKLW